MTGEQTNVSPDRSLRVLCLLITRWAYTCDYTTQAATGYLYRHKDRRLVIIGLGRRAGGQSEGVKGRGSEGCKERLEGEVVETREEGNTKEEEARRSVRREWRRWGGCEERLEG